MGAHISWSNTTSSSSGPEQRRGRILAVDVLVSGPVAGGSGLEAFLDVRFWSFSLWGSRYRLRFSLAADGARQYGNTLLSLGFWH